MDGPGVIARVRVRGCGGFEEWLVGCLELNKAWNVSLCWL